MGFLLLRRVCSGLVTGGNACQVLLWTTSWGTQWGQLNRLPAAIAPCALSRRVIGDASATPFLVPSAPSGAQPVRFGALVNDRYLVDSASSHMLVSKIKPCMSKYKQLYRETANGSLNQLSFI